MYLGGRTKLRVERFGYSSGEHFVGAVAGPVVER